MKKKTFLDEEISIDKKLFDNLKIADIVSWAHLELWCTINNIEVDFKFFKDILCGTAVVEYLFNIVLDAINNTDFLDKFLNEMEVIETIEKTFVEEDWSKTCKAKESWREIFFNQLANGECHDYFSTAITPMRKQKYMLLTAIFNKNPIIVLKFFNKHRLVVHQHDPMFERWLVRKCEHLSKKSQTFANIHEALCKEVKKLNTISMYMN